MGDSATYVIFGLLIYAAGVSVLLVALYWVIRFAVLAALREHYDETHPIE